MIIFDHKIFPITKLGSFLLIAIIDVTSSGTLVPKATNETDITILGTSKNIAIARDELINNSDPNPSKIIPKIIPNDNSFIAVLTSVAGIRGRGKRLFYSSAKSGMNAYLSGLRQKISDKKINVLTVIPGYMNTKPFNIKAPKFLICSPEKAAKIIYKSIIKKKEIVYINFFWRIIMMIINFIPEKIYKKLKF